MKIVALNNYMSHFETVVAWLWSEWGNEHNYLFWKYFVANSLSENAIPQIYIALDDFENIMGTAGLWRCDLLSRQDVYPWFAGLYVHPEYRKSGVGKALQYYCEKKALSLGYYKLFLFTELNNYYEQNGWNFMESTINESGQGTRLYFKELKYTPINY